MRSPITVATIAIAATVNRSGWVACCNADASDPVISRGELTALGRILPHSGPAAVSAWNLVVRQGAILSRERGEVYSVGHLQN